MNCILLKTRALFLCGLTLSWLTSCKEKAPPAQIPPLPVTVAKAELAKPVVYSEYPASLRAASEVEIRARVSGILLEVCFTDGQLVNEEDILFKIDPEPFENSWKAAQADLDRAMAGETLATSRLKRLNLAFEKKAVSAVDVDVAAAELAESKAAVKQATAQLASSKLNLDYATIEAPITGRISRSLVDEGNLVGYADPTLLTTIIDDRKIQAYFEVPERKVLDFLEARNDEVIANRVKTLNLRLKLADGRIFKTQQDKISWGKIDFIENEVSSQTRTNQVRAQFKNPDGVLASGLYGLVGIPTLLDPSKPTVVEVLVLPTEAILRDLAGSFVWVVDDKNTVQRRTVTVGKSIPLAQTGGVKKSVILEGLDGTENVIVAGLQRARDGAVVNAQPAGKAPARK